MTFDSWLAAFSGGSEWLSAQRHARDDLADALDRRLRAATVNSGIDERTLAAKFENSVLACERMSQDKYFQFVSDVVLAHSTNVSSPRCLAHMTAGVPGFMLPLVGVVAALNQNMMKRDASRSMSLMERQVLALLHRAAFGFGDEFYDAHWRQDSRALGIVCSGGSLSNLSALWCARNRALHRTGEGDGVQHAGMAAALDRCGCTRAVILASELAHYSIDKAAALLGLGENSVIRIPVDARQRLDVASAQQVIDECRRRSWLVIAIVGVAGSTDCGSIDPLRQIAAVAAESRIHFHVDAASSAGLMFVDRHRERLCGIELADTITLDAHKDLLVPVSMSILLLRDPANAGFVRKSANYAVQDGSGDLGQFSVEGSRSAASLLLHAALHLVGRSGYGDVATRAFDNARTLSEMIGGSEEFELLLAPETRVVLFRYIPLRWRRSRPLRALGAEDNAAINAFNTALQRNQFEAGHSLVSRTRLTSLPRYRGEPIVALRAVFGNPLTARGDIEGVLHDLLCEAESLEADATVLAGE